MADMNYIELVTVPPQNYYEECLTFGRQWVLNRKEDFTCEDIIDSYNATSDKLPAEGRVWGAVMKKLIKEHSLTFVRYDKYRNPTGHKKPIAVWSKQK